MAKTVSEKVRQAYERGIATGALDKERIDWVERVNPIVFHKTSADSFWEIVVLGDPSGEPSPGDRYFQGATFREAVDRAKSGHQAEEKLDG